MGQTAVSQAEQVGAVTAPPAVGSKKVQHAPRTDGVPPQQSSMLGDIVSVVVGRKLEDIVELKKGKPLGHGAFGTVWKGKFLEGGKAVAVKTLDKQKMKQLKVPDSLVMSEVEFMGDCKGQQWFVQLYDFLDTSSSFHLVLEYCDGGNLEDAARALEGGFSELRASDLMKQLLSGISFLHSKQICHRDIKPQNAMLLGHVQKPHARLRLGDFGIAVRFQPGKLLTEKLGTPAFMAPEMHMLPRSAGYDSKVDLWAAGTFMVFLLALEYPFVDNKGCLLKNDLLRGDLPIWEGNAFQSLFRNVQEATGLCRKRPSPVARDLVRRLLTPKRQVRCNAKEALQHRWITSPPSETRADEAQAQDAPLLQWSDFEEGLTGIQREFQRAAEEVVQAVENIQIGSDLEQQILLDPKDDRLKNCVVCFQESGHFGFFCKQCYHSVCIQCLVKLPKPECPHCRKPASDVAAAQHLAKIAEAFDAQAALQAGSVAWKAALEVGSNVAENLGKVGADAVVDIDLGHIRPVTEEQRKRSSACCVCDTPAGATNHVCPECFASVCFPCAKKLKERQCPSCGDVDHNAEPLKHYLAAAEAWDAAMGLATRAGEGVMNALSTGAEALTTRGAIATSFDTTPTDGADGGALTSEYDQALRRAISVQAQLRVSHACELCSAPSSAFDLACGKCAVSLCSSCVRTRLGPDPCCPGCGDREVFNVKAVQFQRNASQISSSASQLWDGLLYFGQGLFNIESTGTEQVPAAPLLVPGPRHQPHSKDQNLPRLVIDDGEVTTEVSL